jgi:hypothetical protein
MSDDQIINAANAEEETISKIEVKNVIINNNYIINGQKSNEQNESELITKLKTAFKLQGQVDEFLIKSIFEFCYWRRKI